MPILLLLLFLADVHVPQISYTQIISGDTKLLFDEVVVDERIDQLALDFQMFLDYRGVQYVHWVMHKCIMVKVGGKRNTHKVCKKQMNFSKTGGKFFKVK